MITKERPKQLADINKGKHLFTSKIKFSLVTVFWLPAVDPVTFTVKSFEK